MSERLRILPIPGMSRRDFMKLTGGTAVTFASSALLMELLEACAGSSTSGASTNTLTIGIAGDPDTLDPEFGQSSLTNELIKNRYAQRSRYAAIHAGGGNFKAGLSNVLDEAPESFSLHPRRSTVHLKAPQAQFASRN